MDDRLIGRAGFLGIVGAGVAGLFWGKDASGLLGRLTPNALPAIGPGSGWRIYTIGSSMPNLDRSTYRLRVEGHVERPRSFSLAELASLPQTEEVRDFHCVTGWSVKHVRWRGVRLSDFLDEIAPSSGARSVRFFSAEVPYDDSLTLEQGRLPDVMLATEMDGAPLPRPHGAPVRLVMPEMYGYKNVKWVNRIEVRTNILPGYWELHGYDTDAWVGRSNGSVGFFSA